jgi:hypothetical protein
MPKDELLIRDWMDAATGSEQRQRFAIADGASNDSFASYKWARLLTESYVRCEDDSAFGSPEWLHALAATWSNSRELYEHPLDKESFDAGSFATFLGVSIATQFPKWHAIAVGDTCLFHVRDYKLLRTWPLANASEFTSRPQLVPSLPARFRADTVRRAQGMLSVGDSILLATDELAKWALSRPAGHSPWDFLLHVQNRDFRRAVSELRSAGEMGVDDMTLMRLTVLPA